jgi:lactoylglutathione lyase
LVLEQLAAWENDGGHGVLLDAGRATLEIFDQAQADAIDQIEVGRRVAGQVPVAFQTSDSASAAHRLSPMQGRRFWVAGEDLAHEAGLEPATF